MTRFNRHMCMDGVVAGPDLAARRMVMAAILYYQMHTNVMSDHEYDALAVFVRDNFEHVSPVLQFCIDPQWAIDDGLTGWTSSGYTFKYTARLYYGAISWAEHMGVRLEDADKPDFQSVDMDLETGIEFANIRS